jgi:hypothetical protein
MMRERMESGDLDREPELHLSDAKPQPKKSATRPPQKSGSRPGNIRELPDIQDDGFFGSDDEDD